MTKIRTHNKRRKIAHENKVQLAAIEFHEWHGAKLAKAGRWDKLNNTGWMRRTRAKANQNRRAQRREEMAYLNWAEID